MGLSLPLSGLLTGLDLGWISSRESMGQVKVCLEFLLVSAM
jgi:hypothetical protein